MRASIASRDVRAAGPSAGGSHRRLLAALRADLVEVRRPRAEARPLPPDAVLDPASLALDEEALYRGRWVAVAGRAALERPGAWVRAAWPGRADLVVVRGADLALRLLSTTCRHRGVPLLEGDAGQAPSLSLTCPYHGWSYDLAGRLRTAPGRDLDTIRACDLGLVAGAATVVGEEVLVMLDPAPDAAPPALPPWLAAAPLHALRRVHERAHEVAANWKLLVANFQESHHFPRVHPSLEARTPRATSSSVVVDGAPWLGGTMRLADDLETVSGSGRRDGRPFLAAPEHRRHVHDAWLAPNLLTSLQPDYLLTYRLEPQAVDRTRVVFAIDVHASAAAPAGVADLVAFWSRINDEDAAICALQHRGLAAAAPGFRCAPYADDEDGLHAFEAMVAAGYLALDAALGEDDDEAPR